MTRKDATDAAAAPAAAALRFVRADAGERGADAELARWLEERPANERALERVELAAALGRRLAADPNSSLYADAARAVRVVPRAPRSRRALAWGGALAASVLVAVFVARTLGPEAASPDTVTIEAARIVAFDAPSNPVSVLPSGAVVDASAVAVLPFAAAGDATLAQATLAHGLERDVVASLRTVPGLYVIADDAVQPYAATELAAAEIGGQLGARGIVDAAVELADGRVRVTAQLRDAASGATLWHTDFDRPVDELRSMRYEIADGIAATMLDSSLRDPLAGSDRSSAPVYSSKPLLQ
jgi:TolB-like protein